jgi:hypothetical protein
MNEIFNGDARGAIAQIKTGGGKRIIIAELSILFVECGRRIDISTWNMELVSRDQKEQNLYDNLFGINNNSTFTWSGPSGVLGSTGQRRIAPLYGGVQPNTLNGRRLSRCAIERR